MLLCLCACNGDGARTGRAANKADTARDAKGEVSVRGDDAAAEWLTWRRPRADEDLLVRAQPATVIARAAQAAAQGRLYETADAAIPLYLSVLEREPANAAARSGLGDARAQLLKVGEAALASAGDEAQVLRRAREIAAVLRSVEAVLAQQGAAEHDAAMQAYLAQLDRTERVWELNEAGERALAAQRYDDADEDEENNALRLFRQALALAPAQARAMQGVAAVESGLIRRAETAADAGDFAAATRWLQRAALVRPGLVIGTTTDGKQSPHEPVPVEIGRQRIEQIRRDRIAHLRDEGMQLLQQPNLPNHLKRARGVLAEILRIAAPGDAAAAQLRQRIDQTTHYGLLQAGMRFTDPISGHGRGPAMIVVPHGGFRMGAGMSEPEANSFERPQRYVRFDRGFAMARTETTVAQFGRFVAATGYRTRAARRGHSLVYDERGGNYVRRSGVDWRHDYMGRVADADMPVLHVSAKDAEAYARWLSEHSGERYRLPSEAEFEYALRAGSQARYSWGEQLPPPKRSGNLTGGGDRSPAGRDWGNAFVGYGDGYWGPAPVARFKPNAFGIHDLDGNVSEWVADCWHDGYRRAPTAGEAWVNPGCRTRVVRGGAWDSAPAQSRSAWRTHAEGDTTNARTGFRVVREL